MQDAILIAVGGNSLIRAGQKGTLPEQFANAGLICDVVADLTAAGYRTVITHGNGPQVGAQLLRAEAGISQTYSVPLDVCVAMTQGEIGYVLQSTLQAALRRRKLAVPVMTVLTQVSVRKDDPAFQKPTKPIGPFYDERTADLKRTQCGWNVIEDAARGYRRIVASPKPCRILETDVIRQCIGMGFIVIAGGGGGIPVVENCESVKGVEAVIDKDRASALLACELGLTRMVISTDVPQVYINYKQADQRAIDRMQAAQAQELLSRGHFAEGSMKPKIEAAIEFLAGGGREVIITDPDHFLQALDGRAGTHITREDP